MATVGGSTSEPAIDTGRPCSLCPLIGNTRRLRSVCGGAVVVEVEPTWTILRRAEVAGEEVVVVVVLVLVLVVRGVVLGVVVDVVLVIVLGVVVEVVEVVV